MEESVSRIVALEGMAPPPEAGAVPAELGPRSGSTTLADLAVLAGNGDARAAVFSLGSPIPN
jgi:hypothetical protein